MIAPGITTMDLVVGTGGSTAGHAARAYGTLETLSQSDRAVSIPSPPSQLSFR
jgi:hypothetical protein